MTNQEGAKVYHVTLSCTLCRGFWIQAHTPDEAADWADEHLKDQDHFSDQDPYFEVCDVYESSPDEAQKSFQPVIDTSEYPYEDENEY